MGPESDRPVKKGEQASAHSSTAQATAFTETDLPVYYDSEPSGQPPKYVDKTSTQSKPTTASRLATAPQPQHRHSTPAATVSAVLASPYEDLDAQRRADRRNKTLRERWKAFKERNFGEYREGSEAAASASEWNVQGVRLAGGLTTPHRKVERK